MYSTNVDESNGCSLLSRVDVLNDLAPMPKDDAPNDPAPLNGIDKYRYNDATPYLKLMSKHKLKSLMV